METASALWDHVRTKQLCPGARSLAQWLDHRWLRVLVRGRAVPVFPTWGFRRDLVLHDVHHLLLGYDTSFGDEFELAAWELGSGGCAWNPLMWTDRVLFAVAGVVLAPHRIARGWIRGRGCTNLYGRRREDVLESDLDELRGEVLP